MHYSQLQVLPSSSFNGACKDTKRPQNANMGVSIIRVGFWAYYTIVIIRSPQNSIGKYLGPYIIASRERSAILESTRDFKLSGVGFRVRREQIFHE